MSESVGTAKLDLGINYQPFYKEVNGIARNTQNILGGAFGKLGGILAGAFVAKGLWDFSKGAINLASDLGEVQNVVDVVFGGMSQEVNQFAQGALEAFGMSELSAKRYASTMGAMLKSSNITGRQMTDMSKTITQLAGDMASFYNLNQDMAFNKIRSGLAGEVEPLRQLGINMSVANMEAYALSKGMKKQWAAMTQSEQTLLRYNYLLDKTTDAQGDFARTSNSWANQTRILSEQWKSFSGTIGAGLINLLTPVIKLLNTIIKQLQVAANYFRAFTQLISGTKTTANQTAAATVDMGVAVGGAAKDVKKAGKTVQNGLMGFDELNTLSEATAENMEDIAGGASDIGIPDLGGGVIPDSAIDPKVFDPLLNALDTVKATIFEVTGYLSTAFREPLNQALGAIMPELMKWKNTLSNTFADIGTLWAPLKDWFTTNLIPAWQQVIPMAGGILAGLLDTVNNVFIGIKNAVMPILTWFVEDGLYMLMDFHLGAWKAFQALFNTTKSVFDTLWSGAVAPGLMLTSSMIVDTLNSIKGFWYNFGTDIINNLTLAFENIRSLFDLLWVNFLEPIVTTTLTTLKWLWDSHLKAVVDEVLVFVGKLANGALEIYNKFIIPLSSWMIKTLGPSWSNAIQTMIEVTGTLIGGIADVVKGVIRILGGLVDFIVGVFTGNWKKAWQGIKDIFGGITDGIVGVFKAAINLIIDAMNFLIRSMNKVHFELPDWVPGVGGKGFGINIPAIPKLARGGIIDEPTLAMVGENRKKEAIVPLENTGFVDAIASAVATAVLQAMQFSNNNADSGPQELVLNIDGTQFARVTLPSIRKEVLRTGVQIV
jgi:hypothetical protein